MVPLLRTETKSQKDFIDRSECVFCWVMELLLARLAVRLASRCAFGNDAGSRVGSLSPHLGSLQAGCPPQTMLTEKQMLPDPPARPHTAAGSKGARLPVGVREGGSQPSGRRWCCTWLQRVEIFSTPVLLGNCTSSALVFRSVLGIKS